ncbi:hypothetical protein O181_012691 [Austropuccinia psidii MF-1]|uniref:Uncharacterized protein n=1 Tax=Austropuccinia psidii MF-1 TaxID=1389203 RepID=A0A9Q3GMJ4_9BASI|nr:hypothetical protein [Austropuccinia psidii MF-1]
MLRSLKLSFLTTLTILFLYSILCFEKIPGQIGSDPERIKSLTELKDTHELKNTHEGAAASLKTNIHQESDMRNFDSKELLNYHKADEIDMPKRSPTGDGPKNQNFGKPRADGASAAKTEDRGWPSYEDDPVVDERSLLKKIFDGLLLPFRKLMAWLSKSYIDVDRKGEKLPFDFSREQEQFKGPIYRDQTYRYSPRPPIEMWKNRELQTIATLGERLQGNHELEKENWIKLLEKEGASKLRQAVLSSDEFLALAIQYNQHEEVAEKYQKEVIKLGKELTRFFGGEKRLKKLYVKIEEKYKEEYSGLIGLKFDPQYYVSLHSPLLLLTGEEGAKFQAKLAKANIATKSTDGVWHMKKLDEAAKQYKIYVDHFIKTTQDEEAIKHYLNKQKLLNPTFQYFYPQVLEYFREHIFSSPESYEKVLKGYDKETQTALKKFL